MKQRDIWILLTISFVIRLFFAATTELGNDEVYYRIFGLFPDWSYFDHPPMTAWLIWLTTLGADVVPELCVRLSSVVIGTVNTYIIYRIAGCGRQGFAAALLYTGSLYASVILGTFILPDTPLSLFWLLSLWIFIELLPRRTPSNMMLVAGLTVGLAMLSKYTGAYLWAAAGIYILIYNRWWLKQWQLWVGIVISMVMLTPVIIWNVENNWISFTFHSARVAADNSINWLYFGRELMGGVLYNNPVNFALAICAVAALFRGRLKSRNGALLIIFSLPMIVLFLAISLTRETLPHWAAPAYFALILLSAQWLHRLRWAYISASLVALILTVGSIQIHYGVLDLGAEKSGIEIGRGDFTLDTYGWRQGGEKFAELHRKYVERGLMPADASLLQYGWDDAAHIDCYFGLPIGLRTRTIGDTASTHHYEWINARRGGFRQGEDMYLISTSRYFHDADTLYTGRFTEIHPADTIKIYRRGQHIMNYYVSRMKGLKRDKPQH